MTREEIQILIRYCSTIAHGGCSAEASREALAIRAKLNELLKKAPKGNVQIELI